MNNQFYIPDNYDDGSQLFGIPYRNIAEGLIAGAFLVWLSWKIPFVIEIKLTIAIILFVLCVILFAIGVKGESMTQFLFAAIRFYVNKRKMHLQVPGAEAINQKIDGDKIEKKKEFAEAIEKVKSKIVT